MILVVLRVKPGMKPLSMSYWQFYSVTRNRKKPNKCRVQSRVSCNRKEVNYLHMVKAWRFPARIHSKTNLPSSRGSSRCL